MSTMPLSTLSPDPVTSSMAGLMAGLSGGTSSASSGGVGDNGAGVTFNVSGPGGSAGSGGLLSGNFLGVPVVLWVSIVGFGAAVVLSR